MRVGNVKITMIEKVLEKIAPHPCSGCGKVGSILCPDCKYDIINEPFYGCILCGHPQRYGICDSHDSPITRAFTVSTRGGTLETLINLLKFHHTKAAAVVLGELLHEALPFLPSDTPIIPIPTVKSHVRERGYDQVELMTRRLMALRGYSSKQYRTLLQRTSRATQHTVDRKQRIKQSQLAFTLHSPASFKNKTVLLIDDIVTTGSTLLAAAYLLRNAGATVWVATLAYQPLD